MTVGLRCNVEICLSLAGVGALIGGWFFEADDDVIGVRVSAADAQPIELADQLVRVSRADVLEALAVGTTAGALARNSNCGFFAFATGEAYALGGPICLTFATKEESSALSLVLNPEPFVAPLDPDVAAYLGYNLRAVLELLRAQALFEAAPVRKLLKALGPEALELERAMSTEVGVSGIRLGVDLCTVFAGEGLVIVGWFGAPPGQLSAATLVYGTERSNVLPYLALTLPVDGQPQSERRFVVAVPQRVLGVVPRQLTLRLDFADGGSAAVTASAQSGHGPLRYAGEGLGSNAGLAIAEIVADHWKDTGLPGAKGSIARSLAPVVSNARDSAPLMFTDMHESVGASVDCLYYIPERGFFVVGWLVDFDKRVQSFAARWSDGQSTDLSKDLIRLSRLDVVNEFPAWSETWPSDRVGFACFVEAPGFRADDARSLYFVFHGESGMSWRVRACEMRLPSDSPMKQIREILDLVPSREADVFFNHLGPAIDGLWSARPLRPAGNVVHDIGAVPDAPVVSVIVPIYRRYDFIEYQMSLFADDPDLRDAELIYVIDDPTIADDALRLCRERYQLFKVACRVVVCDRNNGFAQANNIGASHARGRLLLLLNSDVMPKQRGWLANMVQAHDSLERPGAVGAKLLFPDGSIQHAGMCFEQTPRYPALWLNEHPGKGHPDRSTARAPRPVPAVTAACLMIARDLYLEVDGLDEGYILGDFEDSDLCLKLRQKGRGSWVAPGVELYHLERQSQNLVGSSHWRSGLTLYNAWRHTVRWDETIRRVMEEALPWNSDTAS